MLDDSKCRDASLEDITSPYMLFYEHVANEDNSDDQEEDDDEDKEEES